MITALLQIIASDNTDLYVLNALNGPFHNLLTLRLLSATRQACSVWVKNRVSATYTLDEAYVATRSDRGPIVQSDRIALKANILPLLSASPSRSINLQLASALKNMVAHDFPDRWPGLLDEIKRLLGSGNIREVHAGCVAALEAVRAFRYVCFFTLVYNVVHFFSGFVSSQM